MPHTTLGLQTVISRQVNPVSERKAMFNRKPKMGSRSQRSSRRERLRSKREYRRRQHFEPKGAQVVPIVPVTVKTDAPSAIPLPPLQEDTDQATANTTSLETKLLYPKREW